MLEEDHQSMDRDVLHIRSVEEAWKAFDIRLQSLQRTMSRLGVPMPRYARVSGISVPLHQYSINRLLDRGADFDISELVQVTRNTIKERLGGSSRVLWVISQRASLPAKIDACTT